MKNNKGQVLVLFVILIPVILLSVMVLIKFGDLYLEKKRVIGNIKSTIDYGLRHISDGDISDKLNNLIDSNINYYDKSVFISEDEIRIIITIDYDVFGIKEYKYKGIINDDSYVIEEG